MSKSILNPAFCATKDDGGDKVPAWTSLARRAATVSGTPPTPRIMTSLSNQPGFAQCHPSGEIGAATKPGNADDFAPKILQRGDFRRAMHGEQKLIAEVGDQHRVKSGQHRRRHG